MTLEDWAARQKARREQDRPVSEELAGSLADVKERAEGARLTRSELLALISEQNRSDSEHRTAVGAAFRNLVQSGGSVPRSVVDAAMRQKAKRLDGTSLELEDRSPERNVASDTNNANDITHASNTLEN